MSIQFQNENLVRARDGAIVVSVPDLITLLEEETGEPIITEQLRYGFRVIVLGIPVIGIGARQRRSMSSGRVTLAMRLTICRW